MATAKASHGAAALHPSLSAHPPAPSVSRPYLVRSAQHQQQLSCVPRCPGRQCGCEATGIRPMAAAAAGPAWTGAAASSSEVVAVARGGGGGPPPAPDPTKAPAAGAGGVVSSTLPALSSAGVTTLAGLRTATALWPESSAGRVHASTPQGSDKLCAHMHPRLHFDAHRAVPQEGPTTRRTTRRR